MCGTRHPIHDRALDPPKPKKETPDDLAEVERAISVLKGRHPEHERVRREDEAKRTQRKAEMDAASRTATKQARGRRVLVVALGVAVLGFAVVAALSFRTEVARRDLLDRAAEPYKPHGFTVVEASGRGLPSIATNVPAGCILAGATKPGHIKLTHPKGELEGTSPILTCLCEGGDVKVTTDVGVGEGLVLMRNDVAAVGGSRAFSFLPFKAGTLGETDAACADASLDAWLDAKHLPPAAPDDAWFEKAPDFASLKAAGFKTVGVVKKGEPFGYVETPANACVVLASTDADDRPALRIHGGANAIESAHNAAAFCGQAGVTGLATHAGKGDLAVLVVPSNAIGGIVGLRELGGGTLGTTMVPAADHAWSAKDLLLASAIPESLVTTASAPDLGTDADARIVAVSSAKPNAFVPDTAADVFSFCAPQLETAVASVCVFSGAQKWRVEGAEATGGIARAKTPFWLLAMQGVTEPAGLKVETELLTLARLLRHKGFEPTTLDAVTELDKGAEVLGRANEDAMVVLGLAPTAPWVFPYSDGAAWTLEGEPRVVPIKPLERVTVTTKAPLPSKATRRTLVFRHRQ